MSDGLTTTASPTADERALIDFVHDRDVGCPLCGYNLRRLMSRRCPECGRELELRVGLSELRQGAWLTAQIALAAAAGIGGIALLSIMMHGWPGVRQRQWLFNLIFLVYLAASPLALGLFFIRRRYLR